MIETPARLYANLGTPHSSGSADSTTFGSVQPPHRLLRQPSQTASDGWHIRLLLRLTSTDLSAFPTRATQKSDSLQDEALLRFYAAEWDKYTTAARSINRIFAYLDRHWISQERKKGRKGVYPVYTVGQVPASTYPSTQAHEPTLARACTMEVRVLPLRTRQEPEAFRSYPAAHRAGTERRDD